MQWPQYIDLKQGQARRATELRDGPLLLLRDVRHLFQPDEWASDNAEKRTIARAEVSLEIDGGQAVLTARPFQSPVVIGPWRIAVESTRLWATSPQYAPSQCPLDVRLAIGPADAAWGPPGLRYPILGYRWRSSPYTNTWGSLVPYNRLYYHRGEDMGCFPDLLEVIAPADGRIVASPHEQLQGSNRLIIDIGDGVTVIYSHMNLEHIPRSLVRGARVRAGEVVGRTGCTWDSRRAQHNDPHLHVGFAVDGVGAINAWAMLAEAYLRDYPDSSMAVAGGYGFAYPGEVVELDGSRSLAKAGRSIRRYSWHLSSGQVHDGPICALRYDRPGCYSEALHIVCDDGFEARDFVQIRVYKPGAGRDIAFGWAYAHPQRGLTPGSQVTVWNRLANVQGDVRIDWGDGSGLSVIGDSAQHVYKIPGTYTVCLQSHGPREDPIEVKLPVVVEQDEQGG